MSENNLSYVDFIDWVSEEEAKAGDILTCCDEQLKIISINKYIPGMSGEPLAVVYAPSKTMPDGRPRAISLCNMSMTEPSIGSLEKEPTLGNIIPWGKHSDILKSYHGLPQLDEKYRLKEDLAYHGLISSSSIFSRFEDSPENERRVQDLTSENFFDCEGESLKDIFSEFGSVIPNPKSMSKYYFLGATADIDGKTNTQTIISQVGVESILSGQILKKIIEEKKIDVNRLLSIYPAAITCFLFNPSITKVGDWYLPSIGELGVFLSNLGEINKTLGILEESGKALRVCTDNMSTEQIPEEVENDPSWPEDEGILYYYGYTKYGSWLWSSTQHDSNYCWTANTSSCYLSSESDKENVYRDFRVRASIVL